jgi:hypothetical protein
MKVLLTSLLRDTGSISAVVSSSPTSNDGRTRGVGASGVTKCLASSKYATRVLYQTLRYDHLSIMNGETLLCLTNARYLLPLKSSGETSCRISSVLSVDPGSGGWPDVIKARRMLCDWPSDKIDSNTTIGYCMQLSVYRLSWNVLIFGHRMIHSYNQRRAEVVTCPVATSWIEEATRSMFDEFSPETLIRPLCNI